MASKSKKKPRAAESDAAEADVPAPEPLPGAGTAAGEKLQAVHDAFTRGDFAQVRELADGLRDAEDVKVREAALELRKRTEVDPVQIAIWAACLLFFLYVAAEYV